MDSLYLGDIIFYYFSEISFRFASYQDCRYEDANFGLKTLQR